MQQVKPSIGLILIRAEWFDSVVALTELNKGITSDKEGLIAALGEFLTVHAHWEVNGLEQLARIEQSVKQADVDLFILVFQVWAEDFYVIPLLEAIKGHPLAVWCYIPWTHPPRPASFTEVLRGSGPVGTLEALGVIHNLGVDFTFTAGSPNQPRVRADLLRAAQAGRVRRALRKARFGVLPHRNEQMQTTFVDEFRLRAELGPLVEFISVREVSGIAETLSDDEVATYVRELSDHFIIKGVSHKTLSLAARASLGLAHVAINYHLDLISLNDIAPELHRVLGLRPCLYPKLYDQNNILVAIEGDLGAATAVFILHRLTGSPVLFTETWFWDESENLIVTGHAGPQDPALAKAGSCWISHDFEFAQSDRTEGAHFQFVAYPGRVTLLQLRCTPTGWQAIVTTGEAIETEPWVEGYPHAVVHLDVPISEFLHQVATVGSTQHWAMAYGDAKDDVIAVCALLRIPLLAV